MHGPRDGSDGLNADWTARAQAALDQKTKPVGSLGRLEAVAIQLAAVQQTLRPAVDPARILLFAADHGVAAGGVSAYPQEVTAQMCRNYAGGGAAINVIAGAVGAEMRIHDVGVAADLSDVPEILNRKRRLGSGDIRVEPAMAEEERDAAMRAGAQAVLDAIADGCKLITVGEMGIGNTTVAAALVAVFTGSGSATVVGPGTGVDAAGLARKREAVDQALTRVAGIDDPKALLAEIGGLEITAITGVLVTAAERRVPVIVDGFIATAAALAALRLSPAVREVLFLGHRSTEPGHAAAIDAIGVQPLLDLEMRLGEGTGAALAIPILRAAAAILRDMASFAEAGVSEQIE